MPLPLVPIGVTIGGAISAWFAKKSMSIASKATFITFQTALSYSIVALQICVALGILGMVVIVYNLVQDLLNSLNDLGSSASSSVALAVNVVKSVGVWDGMLDALALILPFFTALLLVKLCIVSIRLLRSLSAQMHKIAMTALSSGF